MLSRTFPSILGPLSIRSLHVTFTRNRPLLYQTSNPATQSVSPHAPIGVNAALHATANPETVPRPKILEQFSLSHRVGIVSGANRGLGLEMALALCEQGAREVYCLDLPHTPSDAWQAAKEYVRRMGTGGRLEYVCADVRDQRGMWTWVKNIGDLEERMDFCVAAAGIVKEGSGCLEQSGKAFEEVMDVNVNGALYTAQAAGRQMLRFGNPGSIILIASISGSVTEKDHPIISYSTSKSALLQMARNMACELGPKRIRVNSISPGHMLTAGRFAATPGLVETLSSLYPVGRIGRPEEIRGVVAWLASDASSFCTGNDIVVDGGYTAW